MIERVLRKSLMMSLPSTLTVPELGFTMPQTTEIRVVLPAPFGPSKRDNLPFVNVEIDVFECLKAARIEFIQALDAQNRIFV